jgi:hypothetical protein
VISQIGQFLLMIGLILLVIFLGSDLARNPALEYFCFGVLITLAGLGLIVRGYTPPPPSQRFRLFRKRQPDQTQDRLKDRDNV